MAGLRLNSIKDVDILEDLEKYRNNRYKSMTERIKELYRLGLAMERQGFESTKARNFPKEPSVPPKQAEAAVSEEPKNQPIVWNFPKEPSVKQPSEAPKSSLKANLLSNDF